MAEIKQPQVIPLRTFKTFHECHLKGANESVGETCKERVSYEIVHAVTVTSGHITEFQIIKLWLVFCCSLCNNMYVI